MRIDRKLIHPTAWNMNSLKFALEVAAWQMRMHACACYPGGVVQRSGADESRSFMKEGSCKQTDKRRAVATR